MVLLTVVVTVVIFHHDRRLITIVDIIVKLLCKVHLETITVATVDNVDQIELVETQPLTILRRNKVPLVRRGRAAAARGRGGGFAGRPRCNRQR